MSIDPDPHEIPPEMEPVRAPFEGALHDFQTAGEIRLLILDDDPAICTLIDRMLGHLGFTIDTLSEPTHIEEWLRSQQYHLIVMDYVLPGMNTDQVFNWIQETQADACVIVITAYPSLESALTCLRARIFEYLPKPIDIATLRDRVTHCLSSKGLLRLTQHALREAVGRVIRDRRRTLKMTLQSLSTKTEVSLGYLSQIELGRNSASIETLYKICLAMNLRMAELFEALHGP